MRGIYIRLYIHRGHGVQTLKQRSSVGRTTLGSKQRLRLLATRQRGFVYKFVKNAQAALTAEHRWESPAQHGFLFISFHLRAFYLSSKSIYPNICLWFFAATAALRTTRGSLYVCMYVCMSVCMSLLAFLPFTQKIFKQPIPQNLWSYAIFFCGCPYEKKNFKNFVYEGVQHFLDTKYKIIFLL